MVTSLDLGTATDRAVQLRWFGLAVLSLGLFMASMDNTVLNVALPTLSRELDASMDALQWTVDSYQVTYAGLLLVAGALVDRWGRTRTFLVGAAVFGMASMLGAFSPTATLLIWARAAMGIGAALLAPSTLALVSQLFTEPKERTTAFALWSAANGAGGAAGPVLSGLLLEHFEWSSIFWLNVPVAVLVVVFGLAVLPKTGAVVRTERIDVWGGLSSMIFLVLLCWAVISAPGLGIASPLVIGATIAGLGILAAFIFHERKASSPIIQLSLFRIKEFAVAVGVAGLVTAGGAGALFVVTQHLQVVLHFTPLETGVRVLPIAAAVLAGSVAAAHFIQRWGLKVTVLIGLALVGGGFAWMATTTVDHDFWHLLPGAIGFGLGAGLLVPAATQAVMDSLPQDATGAGSATNTALMQVGSALGVAVVGSVLASKYRGSLDSAGVLAKLTPDQAAVSSESVQAATKLAEQLPESQGAELIRAATTAFVEGMQVGLVVCAASVFAALIAVAALYPSDRRLGL